MTSRSTTPALRIGSRVLALAMGVLASTAGSAAAQETPAAPAGKPQPISADLTLSERALDMDHLRVNKMGFRPAGAKLTKDKPAGITKEPAYVGTPMYGAFRVGNGPKNVTLFVVDEPAEGEGKIFVDTNQNGDLTDDGPGKWDLFKDSNYRTTVLVHASWGTPLTEVAGGTYGLYVYKQPKLMSLGYTKVTGREGTVTLNDKSYRILLHENMSDGIFTVPAKDDRTRLPVELCIDIDGDGTFKGFQRTIDGKQYMLPERYSLSEPFEVDGQWYMARPTIGGANIQFTKVAAPGAAVAEAVPAAGRIILPIGAKAPDFTAPGVDGNPVRLSDFKGKIVLLDFWATWCGPCQIAMPGLQKLYDQVRDQGVVVLSLCVYDEQEAYDAWIAKHNKKDYTFTFAFDPAGKTDKSSIAGQLFGVSPLPSMYVIDREGKIAGTFIGTGQEEKIKAVLTANGINVPTTQKAE